MDPVPDWIFFDCFNTLIDDFDASGDEGGLGTLPELAAQLGFVATPAEFLAGYAKVRADGARFGRETLFDDRLRQVLQAAPVKRSGDEIAAAVKQLIAAWEPGYLATLRLAPGAAEMLEYWKSRRLLGVVSNFFLPGFPEKFLKHFGLGGHFRFVLDSATQGFKKPNPLLLMEALSRAGLGIGEGSRVLVIGDRYDVDLAPALELGMSVLHFNRSRMRPGTVAAAPAGTAVIHDWAEFR